MISEVPSGTKIQCLIPFFEPSKGLLSLLILLILCNCSVLGNLRGLKLCAKSAPALYAKLSLRVTESKSLEYFIKVCFTDDSHAHQRL